jgi:hypothetical protein
MPEQLAPKPKSRSQTLFISASKIQQELIREILKEERDQMHMLHRKDIHQRLVDHVRRLVK